MATYSNEYSKFPEQLISMREFKDITNDVDAIIQQIKTYKSEGKYAEAAELMRNNPNLASYMFSATDINTLVEEIYNAQIAALNASPLPSSSGGASMSFNTTTPSNMEVGSVWISGKATV